MIRWAAAAVFVFCLLLGAVGVRSWWLYAALLLTIAALLVLFRKELLIDSRYDAECARIDADVDAGVPHPILTPAGVATPNVPSAASPAGSSSGEETDR